MNNTAEKDLQEKIMVLLEANPQKAMSLAVERYTGLLWHVVEQYLKNPEDIKECVNDTFMEFYTGRERFDSSKGNLASFLAAIARNLAVSRYRRENLRRTLELDEEIPGETGQMEQGGQEAEFGEGYGSSEAGGLGHHPHEVLRRDDDSGNRGFPGASI